ncbi:2-methylene-furan-3-one reductase [Yarrowia sp. C11]|nr:2-methylene-furan-3-one reductase [Yarrowia sp. C11]
MSTSTMRAAYTTAYGGPDKIEYSDTFPKLKLVGPEDVLIRVADASINPIDTLRNKGMLRMLMCDEHPHVFGYDVGGFVEEVGANCTRLKVGDRVYARIGEAQSGTLAGYVSAKEVHVALAPKNLPLNQSAGIPLVTLTAYQAFVAGNVQKGQRVFISKGAGGVGTMAIQLAKHVFGAYVITTGSEHKAELLKELGADEVINYRKEKFQDVIKEPVDFAFDVSDEPAAHAKITKKKGFVAALRGAPSPAMAKKVLAHPPGFLMNNVLRAANFATSRTAWWYGVRYEAIFCEPSAKDLDTIRGFLEEGTIKPVIDSTYDLKEAKAAMEKLDSGRSTGKIILSVDDTLDKEFQ